MQTSLTREFLQTADGRVANEVLRNCIGVIPDCPPLLSIAGVHAHLYGKAPRPGRKLGHITIRARDEEELAARLAKVDALL